MNISASATGGAGLEESCLAYSAALPEVFGPPLWWTLHTTASTYPDAPSPRRREECTRFIESLPALVPCAGCGAHLRAEIGRRDVPSACANANALTDVWCDIHNAVNGRIGKPLMDCSQAREEYRTVPVCNAVEALSPPRANLSGLLLKQEEADVLQS